MTDTLVVIDEIVADPAVEELLAHGEESLTGAILATVAYFKEKKLPFDDFISFAGSSLAPSWDEAKGKGAREIARLISLNVVAGGGELDAFDGNDDRAELQAVWPHTEDLEFLGLTREDLDPFFDLYTPIAQRLGYKYAYRRDGDRVTLTFSR